MLPILYNKYYKYIIPNSQISHSLSYSSKKQPIEDMADFGVGVGLYFSTLRYFAIITFISGLINIPIIFYFGSDVYTAGGGQGRILGKWLLKGSAICTNVTWEPCPTCINDWVTAPDRIGNATNDEGLELFFIKKNNCSVHDIFGAMNLITLFLVTLAVYYFFFSQRKRAEAFDDAEERSSVYSIIVKVSRCLI